MNISFNLKSQGVLVPNKRVNLILKDLKPGTDFSSLAMKSWIESSSKTRLLCLYYNLLLQFSSVAQYCPTLWESMNHKTPSLPVHHQLPEFTQTHVHRVGDIMQPSHTLSSPSRPVPNPSQHQSLFQWVSSSHQVAKVLEFQLQHQSFQWAPRTDLL